MKNPDHRIEYECSMDFSLECTERGREQQSAEAVCCQSCRSFCSLTPGTSVAEESRVQPRIGHLEDLHCKIECGVQGIRVWISICICKLEGVVSQREIQTSGSALHNGR